MPTEGWVNLHPGQDLRLAVDDHRLAVQHLAVDLGNGQRRIPTGGVRLQPPGAVLTAAIFGLG